MNILGLNREFIKAFDTFSDAYIEKEINLVPTLNFTIISDLGKYFKEEYYVQIEGYGEYIVKEKKKSSGRYDVVCKPNLDDFQSKYYPNYTYTTNNLKSILQPLLDPIGWTIECEDTRVETLTGKDKTLLEIILHAMELFEYEFIWDIPNKKIICGPTVGEDKGSYLHQEVNLRELNITTHSYDLVTRLIPKGKDDLGIEGVNNGVSYLEPTDKYTNKIVYGTWRDGRYTIPENLKAAGQKLIDSIGKVYKSYEVDVIDLARLSNKYSYLEYDIGDTITLVDKENETNSKERVVAKKEYLREKLKDSVTLSNAPLSINQVQDKLNRNLENEISITRQYITVLEGEIKSKVSTESYSELETRVKTAEQKLTPTSITQTVENNTTTLAKKSEVKLVDDAWKAEFSSMSIGGTNLLHDSNFGNLYSKKMWTRNQNVTLNWGSDYLAVTLNQDTSSPGILSTNKLSLTPGTYTISGDIATGKAIVFYASDGVTDIRQTLERNSHLRDDIISSTTFTISTNLVNATYGFLSNTPSVGDILYFGKVKLEKGSKRTDWSPHPDELYAGITTIDKDGVTVGREGETIETNLGFDGMRISDGPTEIASFTGSGAVINNLEAESINGDVINIMSSSMTFNIGSGTGYYGDFSEVLNAIGNRKHLAYGVTLTINIQSVLNETVRIEGFSGGGIIVVNIYNRVNGNIQTQSNSCVIRVYGRNTTHVLSGSGSTIVSSADAYVLFSSLNIDSKNTTSGVGITSRDGSNVYVEHCDIINVRDALFTTLAGKLQAVDTKGNVTRYAAIAWGGSIWLRGTIPDGDVVYISQNGGSITRTPSSFSPPATQTVTETRTFYQTDIYTYSVKYAARSTYYGKAAAQNRWDTSMTQMKGRIVFGSSVYSFISGRDSGTTPTVKIRLRRQNSTHGANASVKPTPEWSGAPSFGGATRGNWTPWVTIPYTLFTSSGYTFSFYNGTTGSSYAIWDRAEVQITRTVTQ